MRNTSRLPFSYDVPFLNAQCHFGRAAARERDGLRRTRQGIPQLDLGVPFSRGRANNLILPSPWRTRHSMIMRFCCDWPGAPERIKREERDQEMMRLFSALRTASVLEWTCSLS